MTIEICAVGGYNEVGKNMTSIKIDEDVIICDMGVKMDPYIEMTEDEDILNISPEEMIKAGAVPDISKIDKWRDKVRAIIPTHAHLDHIAAIPFISDNYNAPIIGTPFTTEVLKRILQDERIEIKNEIKSLNPNSSYKINENITIEFINITHSTPQTVMIAIHTKYGTIIYANDFKFDMYPTLGPKPNYKRLEEIGKEKVLALIVDSTYSREKIKMPSESVAKEMLKDVMLGTNTKDKPIIISTFSSHLARLKSIIEFSKRMNRKIMFCGRSLSKYVEAGEKIGIINFSKDIEIVKFGKQIKRRLEKISPKEKKKYVFVVTGHQGEPKATLSKMAFGKIKFKFDPEDHIIFSCRVIPTELSIKNREELEEKLKEHGVRIFKDIHASGHAGREDLRDLINLLNPQHIIPAHGEKKMRLGLKELTKEMKYKDNQFHILINGQTISL